MKLPGRSWRCPYCAGVLNERAFFGVDSVEVPDEEDDEVDAAMCWLCGGVYVLGADGAPRVPDEAQLAAVTSSPLFAEARAAWAAHHGGPR